MQKLSRICSTTTLRLHDITIVVLRHSPYIDLSDCASGSIAIYPHIIRFIFPFSRGLTTAQLMGFPECYFPFRGFRSQVNRVMTGFIKLFPAGLPNPE